MSLLAALVWIWPNLLIQLRFYLLGQICSIDIQNVEYFAIMQSNHSGILPNRNCSIWVSCHKFASKQSAVKTIVANIKKKSLQAGSSWGRMALTNAPREMDSLMPARCSTSCLTLCHKHTLKHTLTPLLSSFHLLLYIINMESRNIRVNSSDTLIKAAKSIGLNWYSWWLSSQERRSPQAAPKIQSTDAGQPWLC